MFVPSRRFGFIRLPLLALAAGVLSPVSTDAQAPAPAPVSPAQFDPSDVYFQAYLLTRSGEDEEKDQNYATALEKFQQADKLLKSITSFYPNWKPDMVAGRSARTGESITRVRPLADEQRKKREGVIAELEGGTHKPLAPDKSPAAQIEDPNPLRANPLDQKRLDEQQRTIDRIRKQLQDSMTPPAQVARQEERIEDLKAQLRAAETTAARLRAELSRAPMEGEVKSLNSRIARLEQERDAMSMALSQSRKEHTETMAKAATLEADLNIARQQAADLQRDLDLARKTSNDTISGMQRQLRTLQQTVEAKDKQLAAAQRQITGLQRELQQSRDAYTQLRTEYDTLAAERDQMKALLNMNEADRIRDLIEQNMDLAKSLRESKEKLDALYKDNNATKDELTDALTDLAVAKARINHLTADRKLQEQRLAELQARLAREDHALANGLVAADPVEIAALRNIIKRQLLAQERRRQASEILLEAARQLGKDDPKISGAIDVIKGGEIPLTEEEKAIIAGRADADLFSPVALDPERANLNRKAIARDIDSYDRAATKAFASDRLLPARELFELILTENPGHVSSLCKLGVVHLRLQDPAAAADTFRKAVELDPDNPYANRMLGLSLYTQGDIAGAEQSVRRSVDLAQDDNSSQRLLGVILYQLGKTKDAESHFKAAITADPMPSEPYFNLAVICSRDKRLREARAYYDEALKRGAVPDPELQKSLDVP